MRHAHMECPNCNEITLAYQNTTEGSPAVETWECECGHISCFHVPQEKEEKETALDDVNQYLHSTIDLLIMRYADEFDDSAKALARVAFFEGASAGLKLAEILHPKSD